MIKPEYIFAGSGSGSLLPSGDIKRYEFTDANGLIDSSGIIPYHFVGTCLDITAFVDGCSSSFTTEICLEDKTPPTIVCAENDTISCVDVSNRLFTGTISDCSPVDTLLVFENIEEINSGPYIQRITRSWRARDMYGLLSDICTQVILVRRLDFVNELMIPPDITLSCDLIGGIGNTVPPSISGEVTIDSIPISGTEGICNTTAVYGDPIVLVDTRCKYIFLRKWTINEWRNGRDSIIDRVQMITIVDTVAPTIEIGLPDTIMRFNTTENRCEADVPLPMVSFKDVCNQEYVKIDMFTPRGAILNQNGGIVTLPVDTSIVYYNISDPCHKVVRDSVMVIVTDSLGPLPICESSMTITIPVSGSGTSIPAQNFDIASIDACGGIIERDVRHMDSTAFAKNISFGCGDIGETIMVVLRVTDIQGNTNTCMTRTTIDGNLDSCLMNAAILTDIPIPSSFDVSGIIFSDMGDGIPGVKVRTSDGDYSESDNYGNYEFYQLGSEASYSITPEYITDFSIGVSTFDLVKIQRHILGAELLDNIYREAAADVNNDGNINILDLLILRKHILGVQLVDNSESWKFVVAEDEYSIAPNYYSIASLQNDMDIDFVGIKMGDVTGDAITDLEASSRSNQEELITYEIIDIGGYKELNFKSNRNINFSGLQAHLQYNSENLEFRNLSGASLDLNKSNYYVSQPGEINISWHGNEEKLIKSGEVLWRVLFKGKSGNEWNYGLDFSGAKEQNLKSEIYEGDEIYSLRLERIKAAKAEISQISNDPNPWNETTNLAFEIPGSGMVELELYDAQNRLVYERTRIFEAGKQKWEVGEREVKRSGVYFGKMSFEGKTRVFKMIKID